MVKIGNYYHSDDGYKAVIVESEQLSTLSVTDSNGNKIVDEKPY